MELVTADGKVHKPIIRYDWGDADFFPDYSAPRVPRSTPMWWPDDDTSIFLSRHIENNIFVRILEAKGLPPEIACKIVLPLVLLNRHYTIPHLLKGKIERMPIYKRLYGNAFCASLCTRNQSDIGPSHEGCLLVNLYKGGGFFLHHPKCGRLEVKPYVDQHPRDIDYARLGCMVRNCYGHHWELHHDYNEQSMGEAWLRKRKLRLAEISKYLFRWDPETEKAQAMRVEYKGNIEAFLAAWKALKAED